MSISRRAFISTSVAGAACVVAQSAGYAIAKNEDSRRLTLLHVTDTHAQLETHSEYLPGELPELQMMGGFARLMSAIEKERAAALGPCFLVDGGDEFQGSGPAAWSEGEVMVEPLNLLGLDVFVPGNWEPAYGPAKFRDQMSRLKARLPATTCTRASRVSAYFLPLLPSTGAASESSSLG